MSDEFAGTSAFITGGGSGIGRDTAIALAAQSCFVTVAGRTEHTLVETVDAIRFAGGEAEYAICDVSNEDSVRQAAEFATAHLGHLDYGINSAGVSGGDDLKPTADYSTAYFDQVIAIDLRGTFLSMKYELQAMHAQGRGCIVNIASGAGVVGVPGFAGYTAAKHGVMGLTKTAALDYGPEDRVNAIVAGLVETPLIAEGRSPEVMAARIAAHPIGRVAQPREISDVVLWLCSDRSSFVTGAGIAADGGYTAR